MSQRARSLLLSSSLILAAAPALAASAPAPVLEDAASLVSEIPKESALAVLRMMKPEGLRPGEKVNSFEIKPWAGAEHTWLALLAVEGCAPIAEVPPAPGPDRAPSLWLALASLPPPPAPPALLARPVGGFMQAERYAVHRYDLGTAPIAIGRGKQAFVVSHGFNIPFAGGGAEVTVDHFFLLHAGGIVPVLAVVSAYDAMYGGNWNEDGSRDHPEEHVSLKWDVLKRARGGFFDVRLRPSEPGSKGGRTIFQWQGQAYAEAAPTGFFSNEEYALEVGALVPPPEPWQKNWLRGELLRLLAAGDAEGVMRLELAFQDQVQGTLGLLDQATRVQIRALAHRAALAGYKNDALAALRLLAYGIAQASASAGVDEAALAARPPLLEALLEVADPGAAAALNDYAFILATKTKGNDAKAEALLRSVMALDPPRAVVYLNLADVLWNQRSKDKKEEARGHYRRYRELSSREDKALPQRVLERAR